MAKTIYYFSGTGNSLAVARGVADKMGDSQIVNIARLTENGEIADSSDTVGIVFPVYFEDMPNLVKGFVEKLKLESKSYIFGIATCGSGPGTAFVTLDRLLKKKGIKLSASFTVRMPDNVVIVFNRIPPIDVQESMFLRSKEKVAQIAETVGKRECTEMADRGKLRDKLEGLFMKAIVTQIYRTPNRFRITKHCIKCGICMRVCPTGNIEVNHNGVVWKENCTQCLACLHWCPAHAVNLGRGSSDPKRYHHPDITVEDMRLR